MKNIVTNILFSTVSLTVFLLSCQEDEEPITPPEAMDTTVVDSTVAVDLKGYVQKGPFINGTAITLSELDNKLVATGKNFTTQIADNRGSFSLKDIKLKSNFVQLQADGFYFDEVKGEKSAAQLTLFALADVSDASSVNVNLLSHLERNRVVYLIQEEDLEFISAKQQAQQEILTAFGIEPDSLGYSEQLDISQEGDQNAMLLAISAVLQGNNKVAELSELTANLITDLREDGTLNSEVIESKLKEQAKSLDLLQIRQHLEDRYAEMGVEATIPNFEQYIDSDGDGILNKDEDDTPQDFTFETQVDIAVNDTIVSNSITISGLKEGGSTDASQSNGRIILNGSLVKDSVVSVRNGDQLQIQLISSEQYADTTTATLTMGPLAKSFSVVTDDYSPDAYSFSPLTDVAVDSLYTSETITLSGLPYPAAATTTNATIVKNGELVATDSVMVSNGDQLALRLLSSAEYAASSTATLDINGVTADFQITTDDYTPDAFSIPVIQNASLDSVYTSESITLNGLAHPAPLVLDSGTLLINGQVVESRETVVNNGDRVSIQLQSGNDFDAVKVARLQVGAIEDTFQLATLPNVWQQKAEFPGGSRSDMAGFVIDDIIYAGAGDPDRGDFYKYDPTTDKWTKVAELLTIIGESPIGFSMNGKGYMGLGSYSYDPDKPNFFEYDPIADSWSQKANYPTDNYSGTAFSIGKYGYVLGHDPTDSLQEFWRYDQTNDIWEKVADFPGPRRYHAQGFSANNKGYIALGSWYKRSGNEYTFGTRSDFWEYDPSSDTWEQLSNYPGITSNQAVGFATEEYAYIGSSTYEDTGLHSDINFWRYHLDSDTWKKIHVGSFYFENRFDCSTSTKGYQLRWIPYVGTYIYEFTPPNDPRYFIENP